MYDSIFDLIGWIIRILTRASRIKQEIDKDDSRVDPGFWRRVQIAMDQLKEEGETGEKPQPTIPQPSETRSYKEQGAFAGRPLPEKPAPMQPAPTPLKDRTTDIESRISMGRKFEAMRGAEAKPLGIPLAFSAAEERGLVTSGFERPADEYSFKEVIPLNVALVGDYVRGSGPLLRLGAEQPGFWVRAIIAQEVLGPPPALR